MLTAQTLSFKSGVAGVQVQSTNRCKVVAARPASVQVFAAKKAAKKQVVLVQDVANLGKKGEVVGVKAGFYRNFLFPKGMAKFATKDILEKIDVDIKKEEEAAKQRLMNAQALVKAFETIGEIPIRSKAGEDGTLFGSITKSDVVALIKDQLDLSVETQDIEMGEIRNTGNHEVSVKLHPEVIAKMTIKVVGTKN